MKIILIAAMAANRVIGCNNSIPWHLPGEQQRFKKTTWGHTVLMGRRTHESIGRPLPGRRNIIITRNRNYEVVGCETAHSLNEAYRLCQDDDLVFNIGGEQLYRQGIKNADMLIITQLHENFAGDTFFPEFSTADFNLTNTEEVVSPYPYSVLTYQRIRN